jgi:cytidine deaminase
MGIKVVDTEKLIREACDARNMAYAPYSHFTVGAALLTENGEIFKGCNIENASYGGTICAERTALFKAVSEGERNFTAIAIVGGAEGKNPEDYTYPCGICRQVMSEFCNENFVIISAINEEDFVDFRIEELLPCAFNLN